MAAFASPPWNQAERPDGGNRALQAATCSLCGFERPVGLMVPDGGQACADLRWYCKDVKSCTQRWTTTKHAGPAAGIPAAIPASGLPAPGLPAPGLPVSGIPASGVPVSGIAVPGLAVRGLPADVPAEVTAEQHA